MNTAYESLDVYRLAFDTALIVHKISQDFPKPEQYGGLAEQMRRSSKGICANLAEGLSKHMSSADERRFLSMALGSAEETRVWLNFSGRLGYVSNDDSDALRGQYTRIAQMLYRLLEKRQGESR